MKITRIPAKRIHLVLYGGLPQFARSDMDSAKKSARALILRMSKRISVSLAVPDITTHEPVPKDPGEAIVWWGNRVPSQYRVSVQTIFLRD